MYNAHSEGSDNVTLLLYMAARIVLGKMYNAHIEESDNGQSISRTHNPDVVHAPYCCVVYGLNILD